MKKKTLAKILAAILIVIVFSVVILRTDGLENTEDESIVTSVATAVVYAVFTIGLAFIGHGMLLAYPHAVQASRELARRKAEWKAAVARKKKAAKARRKITRQHERWLAWSGTANGIYNTHWKSERASVEATAKSTEKSTATTPSSTPPSSSA